MILPAQHIIREFGLGSLVISPFVSEQTQVEVGNGTLSYGLGPAGYDIRLDQSLTIAKRSFMLGSALEYIELPPDILCRVADKSSWARRGILVQNTVIEPGWRGFLTLEISNENDKDWSIAAGTPIAQLIFERLEAPTDRPYNGKYQDQKAGPQEAL